MNLLWKTSKRGDLWIDERALMDLVREKIPKTVLCQGVTLLRDRDRVEVRMALPSDEAVDGNALAALSRSVKDLLAPLGLQAEMTVVEAEPQASSACGRFVGNPLCWAATGAVVTAVVLLGVTSTLTVLAVAAIFYGVSWLFLSSRGKDLLRSLLQK